MLRLFVDVTFASQSVQPLPCYVATITYGYKEGWKWCLSAPEDLGGQQHRPCDQKGRERVFRILVDSYATSGTVVSARADRRRPCGHLLECNFNS